MADTNHSHAGDVPVEGDGIHYRGIVWFVGVLAVTTIASQILMVVLFKYLDKDVAAHDAPRAPLAAPAGTLPPGPNLAYMSYEAGQRSNGEPAVLATFRATEEKKLNSYEWVDKGAGTVRIPIDRAKALLIERGLPVATPGTEAAAKPVTAAKHEK
jgi:hypothetical protein